MTINKIIVLISYCILLTSCGVPTDEEIAQQKRICDINGEYVYINELNDVICYKKEETTTIDCIREYTNGLDEKYNNPDSVSNLKEDDFSKVLEKCNEIFGKK